MPGGRFVTTNWPLRLTILGAFALQPQQLVDAPDWIDMVRYDISATAPGPFTPASSQLAIQRMLADRLGLAVRTETRELPIFALTARGDGRLGPKMKKSAVDCEAIIKANMQAPWRRAANRACRSCPTALRLLVLAEIWPRHRGRHDDGELRAGALPHPLANHPRSHRSYWRLRHRPGVHAGSDALPWRRIKGAPVDPNAPGFFTACGTIRAEAGATRAPVEVLVIDRIERPTEN